jgi:hypothetical protein
MLQQITHLFFEKAVLLTEKMKSDTAKMKFVYYKKRCFWK